MRRVKFPNRTRGSGRDYGEGECFACHEKMRKRSSGQILCPRCTYAKAENATIEWLDSRDELRAHSVSSLSQDFIDFFAPEEFTRLEDFNCHDPFLGFMEEPDAQN